MAKRFSVQIGIATWLLFFCGTAGGAEPRVNDNRYKLELVASDPQIVTPIGMAFDRKGRLLVIESHTHERPQGYKGPAGDRIRTLSDSDGDGRLDRWSTFAEGFRHAMNLLVRDDGAVYLVTRHNVVLLRDTNNDGLADKREELLRLDTKDEYPHNGLSGIALEPGGKPPGGKLLISMGENHGLAYRLVGSDGKELTGKDGAGSVFECTQEGRGLGRVAVGFWNPFSICAVPDGRIFAVDNDPDSSPPCRLVHVIPGGDYGFRYQYGRAGTHPLQAWNGELPGTLPMVCGVGEAPTAVVPHAGALWVTSWGDHRVERYRLVPRGASYGASREIVVQGGVDFRPTGLAIAPDGSLYFGDWMLRDYGVHSHGRIWRLTLPRDQLNTSFPSRSAEDVAATNDETKAMEHAQSDDPFVHAHGVAQLAKRPAPAAKSPANVHARLAALEASRLRGAGDVESLLREGLGDESADVRLFALRWIGDERITAVRDDVARLLDGPQPSQRYYLAVLGTIDWLDHKPELRGPEITDQLLVRELSNPARSPQAKTLALALVSPDNKYLTAERLEEYLRSEYQPLRLEAIRTLALQTNPKRFDVLAAVAKDGTQTEEIRAEAIAGLSAAAEQHREVLEELAASKNTLIDREAERALRLGGVHPPSSEAKPPAADIAAWRAKLSGAGDAAAGRRLFFSPAGPHCSACHRYGGRGGNVGPDLTRIGRSASREKIVTSILQPSQEIAPDYQGWTLVDTDGKTHIGLRLPKPGDDGTEDYADASGKTFTLASSAIEDRRIATTSIMPDNLHSTLSIDDLRDLVAFLVETGAAAADKR
jgi:putative membrane-bound dehydrogenase-like protein